MNFEKKSFSIGRVPSIAGMLSVSAINMKSNNFFDKKNSPTSEIAFLQLSSPESAAITAKAGRSIIMTFCLLKHIE